MADNPNTILIVEDDPGISELIAEKMDENGYNTVCMLSAHLALEWLNGHVPFLIILDFSLPGMNGKDFIIELIKRNQPVPPFIVSTGQGDERVAVEMMKLGARDYIIKDRNFLEMIPIVIQRVDREIVNEEKLKTAEQALRLRESYLTAIIENQPGLIWLKNIEGQFLMVNQAYAEFWGLQKPEELVGKTVMDFCPKEIAKKYIADDAYVVREKKPLNTEEPIFKQEQTKWLITHKLPILENDKVIGTAGLSIDITKRKQAEERLKENEVVLRELNADKDRFMSILAHDLKSPFNCIIGLSEVLVGQVKKKNLEEIEKYAEIIQQSSQQVLELLTNLMEWSQSQTGRMNFTPESVELVNLTNEILLLFAESAGQKSITFKKELPPQLFVYADKAIISTILRNLISNAIKFTFPKGEIVISAQEKQNEITVKVSDNGVGISKSDMEKLFHIDKSHSTPGTHNEQGTGLGLILCKEFAEKHGGTIGVESEVNKGSTFYFTLQAKAK